MDLSLARTFLEIANVGSFLGAAERLHLSQSAVSARVRTLEEELGKSLFRRGHDGVELTPAGVQFKRYAIAMIGAWEQAKLHVQLAPLFRSVLAVGGQYSLWDSLLTEWLVRMRRDHSDVAVRAEFGTAPDLARRLGDGTLDIIVTYHPEIHPGVVVETLLDDRLVLVTTGELATLHPSDRHVYVDWGPELHGAQCALYADDTPPAVYIGNGSLGLSFLLTRGGRALLPYRMVRPYLDSGRLGLVADAPVIEHMAYAVYGQDNSAPDLAAGVVLLRDIASESGL